MIDGGASGGALVSSLLGDASSTPPEVLTEAEAVALIRACSARAPTGVRNRALTAVLCRCGLRISEESRRHTQLLPRL